MSYAEIIMWWMNQLFSIIGFFSGIWAMQRPALQRARLVERLALATIVFGMGWSALLPLNSEVDVDGGRLCVTAGSSIMLFVWMFWAADAPLIRRGDE